MTITDKRAMLSRIDARFRSGNSVPVERANITASEWAELRADLEAAEAARDAGDFVMVPREPHPEMLAAGCREWDTTPPDPEQLALCRHTYLAMISNAPVYDCTAPSSAEQAGTDHIEHVLEMAPGAPEADERREFERIVETYGIDLPDEHATAAAFEVFRHARSAPARARSSAAPSVAPFGYVDPSAKYSAVAFAFESRDNKTTPVYLAPVSARDGGQVAEYQWRSNAFGEWGAWVNCDKDRFDSIRSTGKSGQLGFDAEARALYTTPPADARDGEDARRYRWLRDVADSGVIGAPYVVFRKGESGHVRFALNDAELDAAIDRAMGGE